MHACQRVNELLTCGRVCTRETALEAEESKCWVPPPPEPEPSELVPKTPYSCKIGLRQLADTLDDIRKAAKRQPLIIDLSGNAQTFLRLVFCALLSACLQRLPGAHARTGRACVPLTNSLCVMPGLERCIPQDLYVPWFSVMALYAAENGKGMGFPLEEAPKGFSEFLDGVGVVDPEPEPPKPKKKVSHLKIVK